MVVHRTDVRGPAVPPPAATLAGMTTTAQARQAIGAYGEGRAARHLADLGMSVLERNWRCDEGEIDIVLRDG